MRVDNQDIARMARQLCNEENETLHVSPWKRHRHFTVPSWLVALPAAALVGFFLGVWTNVPTQTDTPLTAFTDTVYIKVNDRPDTAHVIATAHATPLGTATPDHQPPHARPAARPARHHRPVATGQPMQSDHIRYDLLVRN